MRNMIIELIDIDELTPYDKNSKIHTPEQVRHIANSITEFGFNDPIGICGDDNIVLEGNGRLEALRLLDIKQVPCVRLDHLDAKQRRAYVITHNHICLETGLDEKVLLRELRELQEGFDFERFGIELEKQTVETLQAMTLDPYKTVHYLVSVDINQHDMVVGLIEQLKRIGGVSVESTLN